MSYKKILVAIDRPPVTPKVYEQALDLAKKEGASLMVFHCHREPSVAEAIPPIIDPLAGAGLYPTTGTSFGDLQLIQIQREQLEKEVEQDREWLQNYCQNAIARGVPTECDDNVGSPGPHICDLARDWGADLIVIGRKGHNVLKEVFLGSVSSHVIHHAPCSVLVVQEDN